MSKYWEMHPDRSSNTISYWNRCYKLFHGNLSSSTSGPICPEVCVTCVFPSLQPPLPFWKVWRPLPPKTLQTLVRIQFHTAWLPCPPSRTLKLRLHQGHVFHVIYFEVRPVRYRYRFFAISSRLSGHQNADWQLKLDNGCPVYLIHQTYAVSVNSRTGRGKFHAIFIFHITYEYKHV